MYLKIKIMKQTAVEFLQESLSIHFSFKQKMQFEGLFQQAKEMEKEQIMNAHYDGKCNGMDISHQLSITKEIYAEQYYNETFTQSSE